MAQPQKGLQATLIHCRNPKKGLQVQQQIAEIAGFAENPPKHHRNRREHLQTQTQKCKNRRRTPLKVAANHLKT